MNPQKKIFEIKKKLIQQNIQIKLYLIHYLIMTILMQVPKEIKTNLLKIYLLIKIQEKNHIRVKVH